MGSVFKRGVGFVVPVLSSVFLDSFLFVRDHPACFGGPWPVD